MRIAYFTDTMYRSGGMERVLAVKANYLADEAGCEVYIVTFHQKGRKSFFALSDKVKFVDLGVNLKLRVSAPLYRRRVMEFIDRENPDVCISLCGLELFQLSRMKLPCAKIAEFHFSYQSYFIRGKQRRLKRFISAVSKMDTFVVLTREDAKIWGRFVPCVKQIYNPSTFSKGDSAPLQVKRCISGGRFAAQKNYDAMLRIWAQTAPAHPDWRLDIFGEGPLRDKMIARISELGIEESVRVNAPTSDMRSEMLQSSVYLMTSLYEGFPMVLIEAASVGLPAIAFDCPSGPSEAILDGKTGRVIDNGNEDEFARALAAIMDDEPLRREMGEASSQWVENFNASAVMQQWLELFSSVCQKKG